MFKRERRLRKQMNDALLEAVETAKNNWLRQKDMIEKSIEPHELVLYETKLAKARYLFLLREVKVLFSDKPS